ncbi:MAG: hypothetical protein HY707_09590, partial [Ignavibacteriae bacterium]|nr:hypothetical protein [Ignavibacteriota bacterium]
DTVPEMLKKLEKILVEQGEYKRMVPLITVALLFKDVYVSRWETQPEEAEFVELQEPDINRIKQLTEKICAELSDEFYPKYVSNGKYSQELFTCYVNTIAASLNSEFGGTEERERVSYFECLKTAMPGLTRERYVSDHRAVIEYLARIAKNRMKEALKAM